MKAIQLCEEVENMNKNEIERRRSAEDEKYKLTQENERMKQKIEKMKQDFEE